MRQLLFFYLLMYGLNCFAQGASHNAVANKGFTARENIIFEDDFSNDTLGHFPHKWVKSRKYAVGVGTKTDAIVRQEGSTQVLSTNGLAIVKPNLTETLTDSFTVEGDFLIKDKGFYTWFGLAFGVDKHDLNGDVKREFIFYHEDGRFSVMSSTNTSQEEQANDLVNVPPIAIRCNNWYHLGFSYHSRHISCYMDSTLMFDIPDCGFRPVSVSIGLCGSAICRHVTIANGRQPEFARLITEKKFATHAILFEYNKTTIRADSDPFLARLAAWLLQHPAIRIEIDGHTDSDGSAASNLNLSLLRAREVEQQLVAKGIPIGRLTTKGFGATMPLQSNSTEEGKADNRRVEFVLLAQ